MPKKDEATAWLHRVLQYDSEEQTHTGHPTPKDDDDKKPPPAQAPKK